jgi:hypothetical protein
MYLGSKSKMIHDIRNSGALNEAAAFGDTTMPRRICAFGSRTTSPLPQRVPLVPTGGLEPIFVAPQSVSIVSIRSKRTVRCPKLVGEVVPEDVQMAAD